jgi:hypothetical protein
MPLLFAPTIGAALAARYWWVRCPACRTRQAVDAVISLIPALSCPRANPPFAELVRLSPTTIADEMREEHGRRLRNP